MASKLRRTPLFSYNDGNLCLSSYPSTPQYTPRKKQQPAYNNMECGVSATYSPAATNGAAVAAAAAANGNGIMTDVRTERSPAKSGLHVNFTEKGEVKERREKFLTAKYGSHQMSLIRKRLAVEMWLYDELQRLFEITENSKTGEVDIDIDELLDMESDEERRRHLQVLLADAKKSPLEVKKFVDDLLERAKTL